MALDRGTRLGPYEIGSQIGKGGMGEVYRARDTTLDRDVAIKILPEEFAADEERLARFEREAKLLASLNHPSIAIIHGFEASDGVHYLVLEFVPGDTLAERMAREKLATEEALELALQVAEALEEAHERGIVHRDLKPANVKVTPEGKVKVLDFGLGKALDDNLPATDSSHSPTLTRDGTRVGTILGTAAYMSPEQARGKTVDKRSDIFSFGSLLYEMLTGAKAFHGDEVSDILAAVLRAEPDLGALPKALPPRVRELLRRCLVKDSRRRWRDIGDVRVELEEVLRGPAEPDSTTPAAAPASAPSSMLGYAATAVLAATLAGLAVWALREEPAASVTRFTVSLPGGQTFTNIGRGAIDLSPDGSRLAYVANETIYVRSLNELEAAPLRGPEGFAIAPFFSPDGEWIGFFDGVDLKKVPVEGGAVVTLCTVANPLGASWEVDGTILFGQGTDGIWRVSDRGGEPELVFAPDPEGGTLYYGPRLLPGGDAILFTTSTGDWTASQVVVRRLDTGEERIVVDRGRDGRLLPSGHLIYADGGTLFAVPFDLDRRELSGAPVPVVEGVAASPNVAAIHVAPARSSGALAFIPVSSIQPMRKLSWRDRTGAPLPIEAPRGYFNVAKSSPQGDRIALTRPSESGDALWIYDVEAKTWTRLTFEGGASNPLVWTRDGASIVFTSDDGGLFIIEAAGGSTPVRLTESLYRQHASALSPDGKWVVYHEHGPEWGPWLLDLEGSEERTRIAADGATFVEFSPDGRWLAYTSDESGRNEIYVEPFPGPGGRFQLSDNGGTDPIWRRQGELLYRNGPQVVSVAVSTAPTFSSDTPRVLFETAENVENAFDVSPDGERLFLPERAYEGGSLNIVVVLNWLEELKRLVPTDH